jgi:RNA polymerase sigma-70 factor (ECF subfamily)
MELDPVAPAELADAYISHLVDWLRRRNSSTIDDHMLMEAAGDAILSFAKKPDTYRADCGKSLIGYLQMSALGDLKNLLKKRSRQVGRSVDWDSVELSPDAGNALWHVDDPLDAIISVEAAAQVRRELLPVIQAGLSAEERDCLDLYLDGERQTDPYTTALRISGLPEDEQRRRVKQVKDMLKKRIERGRSRHDK